MTRNTENEFNRRNFLSLLLIGGAAFALGGFAAIFGKRRAEDNSPTTKMKPAAYWRRVG